MEQQKITFDNFSKKDIFSIHYMRAFAALFVAIYHILGQDKIVGSFVNHKSIEWLNSGVDIFFIISGFVIFTTTLGQKTTPLEFIKRRIIRVAPLYWFFTISFILMKIILPGFINKESSMEFSHIIKSLFFIPQYHYDLATNHNIWPVLIPGWTLNYEMFFYFVFSALMFMSKNNLIKIVTLVFISLVLLKSFVNSSNPIYLTYTNPLILEFLIGIYFSYLYFKTNFFKKLPFVIGISLFVLGSVLLIVSNHPLLSELHRFLKWGIPSSLLIFSCLILENKVSQLKNKFLWLLGESSYSLYLSHMFSIVLFKIIWTKLHIIMASGINFIVFVVLSLFSVISGAIFVYYFVEKPMTNYFRNKLKENKQKKKQLVLNNKLKTS